MTTAITKESLAARIVELESGARSLKEDYTLAAYKMLMATMEAEPVAVCSVEDGQMCPDGFGECDHSLPDGTHELYSAPQPAPVVPDAEAVYARLSDHEKWSTSLENVKHVLNACRAAMLQAGNSPESCSAKFGNFQHYWHSKGYVMVPKEPTEAMCDISHIGVDVYCGITDDNEYYSIGGAEAAKVWKAMLAAAPQSHGGEPATVPDIDYSALRYENMEPCAICGKVSSHPEGWHYCHGKK